MMSENDIPPIASETPKPPVKPGRQNLALLLALAALASSGWQWHQSGLRQAEADAAHQATVAAQHASGEQMAAVQKQMAAIEARFADVETQNSSLQSLAQEIARGREEATLIEVEHAVTLAAQQLQLAGNVRLAALALQSADARLASLDRPQYLAVRKALAKDLARLSALPFVDVPGISLRLEQFVTGVDRLPLASYGRPVETRQKVGPESTPAGWQRLGSEFWREIKGLVRIQRFDGEDAALLAPGQEFLLRENLKLRLLSAKLALLARDQSTFRNELTLIQTWLGRHFVADDKAVQAMQQGLRQMMPGELNGELPTLNDTQAALRGLRNGKEKR